MLKTPFILNLILLSILILNTSDAQDAMQWNLPDGAKARFGKGKINEIQYSPDGKILAVATRIGLWLYDTTTYQEISLLTDHKSSVTNITIVWTIFVQWKLSLQRRNNFQRVSHIGGTPRKMLHSSGVLCL